MADELNISRSKVRNALQEIKLEEVGDASVPEDKMRSIIREELERARDVEEEEGKASGEFPVMRKMGGGMEVICPGGGAASNTWEARRKAKLNLEPS